jgi:hypothetical protein
LPNRIKPRNGLGLSTDHETKATFEAVHSPAGPDVDIRDTILSQSGRATNVILEEAVATVDHHVAPV